MILSGMREILTEEQKAWKDYIGESPFRLVRLAAPGLESNPELKDLEEWYLRRSKLLPEMEVQITGPMADGEEWLAEGANVKKRTVSEVSKPNKIFYSFVGGKIRLFRWTGEPGFSDQETIFEWRQPFKKSSEEIMKLSMLGEEVELPIFGVLGAIKDSEGRTLMTVGQEPTAETPNHAIIRLPIQASSGKINLMKEGNVDADRQLAEILGILDTDIEGLFKQAEQVFPVSAGDTNMEIKHNVMVVLPTVESSTPEHKRLVEGESRKWLSPNQLAMAGVARTMNDHGLGAVQLLNSFTILADIEQSG